jgi:hypothetical protein
MAKLTLNSTSTGSVSFDAPVTTENTTITVPAANAGMQVMTLATAQNTTSGTSIDFTGIPSWVKKITVMFNGVSTSGSSHQLIQLGTSSGVENSGYVATGGGHIHNALPVVVASSAGFLIFNDTAGDAKSGSAIISLMGNNMYAIQYVNSVTSGRTVVFYGAGSKSLSGTLDRIRITTVNGTDTFDAGSVNILYEGY